MNSKRVDCVVCHTQEEVVAAIQSKNKFELADTITELKLNVCKYFFLSPKNFFCVYCFVVSVLSLSEESPQKVCVNNVLFAIS